MAKSAKPPARLPKREDPLALARGDSGLLPSEKLERGVPPPPAPRETLAQRQARMAGGGVQAAISRTHQRYDQWAEEWRHLGHIYEGDGPYMTGDALIPHVRELTYAKGEDGKVDFSTPTGEKRKFLQRKKLARYENWAATLVDLFVDYQYAKLPERKVETTDTLLTRAPIEEWWEDVDGFGTPINDWLKRHQTLVNVFGHGFVVMDRLDVVTATNNITPAGQKRTNTLRDLGRPCLRFYGPLDVPDWLAPLNQLTSVKLKEAVERKSLMQAVTPTDFRYTIWDNQSFTIFNHKGEVVRPGQHGYGVLPVKLWYAKRRSRMHVLGRSLLRSSTTFRDHYNLISELRELFRAQAFSMLHIQLADDETVQQARERLGEHAGTDAIVFSRGGAEFIAPEDGPARIYMEELSNLERKTYRMLNLPWESDSTQPEAEGSRKLKSEDLNQSLASLADFAEDLEKWVAQTYYLGISGNVQQGLARFKAAKVNIQHPEKFNVEQLGAKAEEAKLVIELGMGKTATKAIKMGLLPLFMPDISAEDYKTVEQEIEEIGDTTHGMQQAELMAKKNEAETGSAKFKQEQSERDTDAQLKLAAAKTTPPAAGGQGGKE